MLVRISAKVEEQVAVVAEPLFFVEGSLVPQSHGEQELLSYSFLLPYCSQHSGGLASCVVNFVVAHFPD